MNPWNVPRTARRRPVVLARRLAIGAAAVAGGVLTLRAWGARRWDGRTQALLDRLEAARTPPPAARVDARELDGLPAPVARWLRAVLPDGAPTIAAVDVVHRGTFDVGGEVPRWRPFVSRQRVVTSRPGFVWDGRVSMAPGVAVHVHDAYVAGEGVLNPAVAGLVPIADLRGGGEVARGEAMRWLAESAWYPTAVLPSQGVVRWAPVDARSARATLVDGALEVTLAFRFGDDGLLEAVRADARGRTVGDRIEPTPWEGRWSRWAVRGGLRVPLEGEVAWLLPGGARPYWRGTIESIAYETGA